MTSRRVGVRAALVDGCWVDGDVSIAGGHVEAVGLPAGPRAVGMAVPGFVDLQVNGFAGVDFSDCDNVGHERAAGALARTGVTSYLVTVPTAPPDRYVPILSGAAAVVANRTGGARAIGVHLEGPFLTRPGAHPSEHLRRPDISACRRLLELAPVRLMTMAPEPPGAIEQIAFLHERGVVVAVGHTEADAAAAHRAFDAGATAVTHLWNAMVQPGSRQPGVVGAALARRDVTICLIADFVHVAAEIVALSMRAAAGRSVVVTDASPFAGLDPAVTLDNGTTRDRDGAVRLADGTLAGSSATLIESVRRIVANGLALDEAIDAVTRAPAALLGDDEIGQLRPGAVADITVLDEDLSVRYVLVGGRDPDVHKRTRLQSARG